MSVDLHSLNLIRLVARYRSFSEAAREASISQSALSRQISNAETKLGLPLFYRSTRKVTITEAGAILLRETASVPNLVEKALRRLKEECLGSPAQVKVALSPDISLAHIPGIIGRNIQDAQILVTQMPHNELLSALCESKFDLGIFTEVQPLPEKLAVTHMSGDTQNVPPRDT